MPARPDGRPSRPRRPAGGFTLIELMIVVFIIGILVALTVTMIPKVYRAVRGAQTNAQLSTIAAGIQAYYADFRAYPGPLPNDVLGGAYYATPRLAGSTTGNRLSYLGTTNQATGATTYTALDTYQQGHITGAENLVLGLLGGLQTYTDTSTTPPTSYFAFNPNDIYPDNIVAAPKGAMNLGTIPKRSNAYIQVKTGDLSPNVMLPDTRPGWTSMYGSGCFGDDGGHFGFDSMIPEFLDKYSRPLPILYLRANVGTSGVVTRAGNTEAGAGPVPVTYQYDLAQVLGYTGSLIGTLNKTGQDHHGLQDIMPSASVSNPTADTVGGNYSVAGPNEASGQTGANAFAYLKDTNTPALQPGGGNTTNGSAHPRQKDAYILISAGPDGVYGTADDIVYPGGAVVPQ